MGIAGVSRSHRRHEIAGKNYTSTDPAEQKSLHNEGTYLFTSENLLCCLTAPSQEEKRRLPTVGVFNAFTQRLERALQKNVCMCATIMMVWADQTASDNRGQW